MNRTKIKYAALVRLLCMVLLATVSITVYAQPPVKKYSVKNGKMYIEVSKNIAARSLDSFIKQFALNELHLNEFIMKNMEDSIRKNGWQIERNNKEIFILSKALRPADKMDNPVERMIFSEIHPTFEELFPATSSRFVFGYNKFRNKPFYSGTRDSVVRFFLRNTKNARRVMLAGSFNNWDPDKLEMQKTDSGWIAPVKLGAGKYWYKFIVDGNWITDPENLQKENDGFGNINSIYYKPNTIFTLTGFKDAKNVILSGSFNNWNTRDIRMQRTTEGWQLPVYLSEGTHTYKYIVDGKWMRDPQNNKVIPDGTGDFNSMHSIGKSRKFQLNGFRNASRVRLAGSFNNWREFELEMHKTSTGWELDYVLGPGNYEYKFLVDEKWIPDPSNAPAEPGGNSHLIVEPNYHFKLKGYQNASRVFLAGDFNNWNPHSFPMKKQGNDWVLPLHLANGKHRYKFIVDGNWILDPSNKLWEQNAEGTGNSILWIGR